MAGDRLDPRPAGGGETRLFSEDAPLRLMITAPFGQIAKGKYNRQEGLSGHRLAGRRPGHPDRAAGAGLHPDARPATAAFRPCR
ncbi:MAG: hypothetical protein WDM85_10180 [Caulobacteraceae bacterium]